MFTDILSSAPPVKPPTSTPPPKTKQTRRPHTEHPPEPEFVENEPADLPPLIIDNEHVGPVRESTEHGPSLFNSPRQVFWVLYPFLQVGPLVLSFLHFTATNGTGGIGSAFFALFSMAWIFPCWGFCVRLTWLVVPFLVSSFRCPHCHEEHEAVSRWKCSCGFCDHRERHALWFKCPLCKGVLGHFDCNKCGTTIRIR